MKVVVLGGTGHIGTFLVPMLVKANYEVVSVTRSKSKPYIEDDVWTQVKSVFMDRTKDADFLQKLAAMTPDIIIDLINFRIEDTKAIVEAFKDSGLSHYLFCSSIWAHGRAEILPFNPDDVNKKPLDSYGKEKFKSELYLKKVYKEMGFPATIIMPGQISVPGWNIISPLGNANPNVFQKIANGEKIYLPNLGMETIHHVHGEDVAQIFLNAITHREKSLGQSFHAVSGESITLYGYAKFAYEYFNQEMQIDFLPWEEWCKTIDTEEDVTSTYYHIARSGYFDLSKEWKLLEYKPKHSNIETIESAISSYLDRKIIEK